jgi:transposase-like protein
LRGLYRILLCIALFYLIAIICPLAALPHSLIAARLGLSVPVAQRRNKAARALLKAHEPTLYQAVLNLEHTTPEHVTRQALTFKLWLTELLSTSVMPCLYCTSLNTVRIGQRLNFRCRTCRCTFNPLKAYQLDKLSHCELWLPFIDKLLDGATCQEINRSLGINVTTAAKWQRYFLRLIRKRGYLLLADFCLVQRRCRYRKTWLAVQAEDSFLPSGSSRVKPKWY